MTFAISDTKANRLFWLGRYAERAYLSIHFLRRYLSIFLTKTTRALLLHV